MTAFTSRLSCSEFEEMPALTTEQKQEIERRHAEHVRNPGRASMWDDVRERLLARYR
jgi:putative addiction module component (TIGR02574 family)